MLRSYIDALWSNRFGETIVGFLHSACFHRIKMHVWQWLSDMGVCTTGSKLTWTLLVQQCPLSFERGVAMPSHSWSLLGRSGYWLLLQFSTDAGMSFWLIFCALIFCQLLSSSLWDRNGPTSLWDGNGPISLWDGNGPNKRKTFWERAYGN